MFEDDIPPIETQPITRPSTTNGRIATRMSSQLSLTKSLPRAHSRVKPRETNQSHFNQQGSGPRLGGDSVRCVPGTRGRSPTPPCVPAFTLLPYTSCRLHAQVSIASAGLQIMSSGFPWLLLHRRTCVRRFPPLSLESARGVGRAVRCTCTGGA